MTQEQLGELVGTSRQAINAIETEKFEPLPYIPEHRCSLQLTDLPILDNIHHNQLQQGVLVFPLGLLQ